MPSANFGFALAVGGAVHPDVGQPVATDAAGNVYTAGAFTGTVDFDPGPGTFNLTSAGLNDIFVAKYNSTGGLVWARRMGGGNDDQGYGLAVDGLGNVYTTGFFRDTADFDPGPGTFNLISTGAIDAFVSKLDSSGNFVWARHLGGDTVVGHGVAVDGLGNVYTTGLLRGAGDFDPGPNYVFLTSGAFTAVFVSKLDSGGNFVWARSMGGSSEVDISVGNGVAVDGQGNVYTTGSFQGTADFDPGPGTFNLTSAIGLSITPDAFVSKLDSGGNFVWARSVGGKDVGNFGNGVAVDGLGNVYTTGGFGGTADFDPGPGTFNLTSASPGATDAFVWKLDGGGNLVWARSMGGQNLDQGLSVAVDGQGSVYTTGGFIGTVDFDPGPGTFNLTSAGSDDVFVSKLDSGSNFVWAAQMGGGDSDYGYGVAVDGQGNVYTTGNFQGTADFDPGLGTFNLTSAGSEGAIFLSKLTQSTIGDRVWHDLNGNGIQDPGEPGVAGAVVELVGSNNPTIGDGDDVSLGVQITDANGAYHFTSPREFTYYYLAFRTPAGFAFTVPDVGNDQYDSDASPLTGRTALFRLTGTQQLAMDAGLTGPAFGFAVGTGSTGNDVGNAVAVDSQGNVYTTGFFSGTVDFDSGPGTVNLTSAGLEDVFVAKYTAGGVLLWARGVGGSGSDKGNGVAVDALGNVYTTGFFQGTADFDPGPGTVNLTSGIEDVFVSKLDSNGNFVWARQLNSSQQGGFNFTLGRGLAVDGQGNVYTTGSLYGTADFDPGPGTANLTSAGYDDVFVWKLDTNGNFVWARSMGGSGSDAGYDVAVDGQGNVFTTGQFRGKADFDPGAGTFNLTTASAGAPDAFVSKLDSNGNFLWARQLSNSTGSDEGFGVAVDAHGNVYTTGAFTGTADFDPGPGTVNLTSAGSSDVFVWKLSGGGSFIWARGMGGSGSDAGYDVAVDGQGNVYTTGYFQGTADFDPGPGIVNLTSAGGEDVFASRLDGLGNFISAGGMGGGNDDEGHGVAVDGQGDVFTTGFFGGTADFDPGPGTFNLTSAGNADAFLAKLVPNATRLTIGGEQANQSVNDNATILPFKAVVIGEGVPSGQPLTVTVSLLSSANGVFTLASLATSGFSNAGGGVYQFLGTAAQATTALRQLVFAPTTNQTRPGQSIVTTFTIDVTDGFAAVTSNRTTAQVLSVNDPPHGVAGSYAATMNQTLVVSAAQGVLRGASDPDPGAVLTAQLRTPPSTGQLTLNADGSFSYTPPLMFSGAVTFQFVIADGQGGFSDPITVTIRVQPVFTQVLS